MNNKFFNYVPFLFLVLAFTFNSCSEDNDLSESTNQNEILTDIQKQSLNFHIKQTMERAISERMIIAFDVKIEDGNYVIYKEVEIPIETMEEVGDSLGFSRQKSGGDTIKVTCKFPDGTSDSVTCAFEDFPCVTLATYGCLNSGGTATSQRVPSLSFTFEP